jgi:hypothetical protein
VLLMAIGDHELDDRLQLVRAASEDCSREEVVSLPKNKLANQLINERLRRVKPSEVDYYVTWPLKHHLQVSPERQSPVARSEESGVMRSLKEGERRLHGISQKNLWPG